MTKLKNSTSENSITDETHWQQTKLYSDAIELVCCGSPIAMHWLCPCREERPGQRIVGVTGVQNQFTSIPEFTWMGSIGFTWLIWETLDIWCRIWKIKQTCIQTNRGFLGYLETFTKPPLLQESRLISGGCSNLVVLLEWKVPVEGFMGAGNCFHWIHPWLHTCAVQTAHPNCFWLL